MAHTSPLSWLVYILASLIYLSSVSAVPVVTSTAKKPVILGPKPPHFVAYSDESQFGIPSSSDLGVKPSLYWEMSGGRWALTSANYF